MKVGDIVCRPDALLPDRLNFGTVIALANGDWSDLVKVEWSDGWRDWESISTLRVEPSDNE